MEDDLNLIFKMEEDIKNFQNERGPQIFLKMEDDLNISENRRQPLTFEEIFFY